MEERTSFREDLVTIGLSLWIMVGLFVDAYNHVTNPDLETFWTPWHAIFYSGFLATAAWLVAIRLRRRPEIGADIFWAPQGYRLAMYGIALFAAGGIGDALWHEVFGVETSLDALLSPTHLLLYVGLTLIISAPVRARWLDADVDPTNPPAPSLGSFFPALASLTFAATLTAFFFEYAWTPLELRDVLIPYNPATNSEEWAAFGFLTIVVTTLIAFTPLLVASRRWRLPFGSVTTYMLLMNLLLLVGFDKDPDGFLATLAAGIVMDVLIRQGAARRLVVVLPPLVLWASYFGLVDLGHELGWPPEIWGGSIFFAVLAAIAVDGVMSLAVAAATVPEPSGVSRNVDAGT